MRLLKNICGLWLLERCRKDWQSEGKAIEYQELLAQAAAEPPLQFLIDPDDSSFVLPQHMPQAIAAFCAKSGQSKPLGPGPVTRTILESLALKYRQVLESLERLVGTKFQEIRVVGGGSRNDLLNQFTADAIGRRVLAGPVEATALGNLAMQMLATGAVASLNEARDIIATVFPREFLSQRTRIVGKKPTNFSVGLSANSGELTLATFTGEKLPAVRRQPE